MNNDIKNFFMAGLGSAAYTYEKATTLIDDFVQKGKLTLEEGKDLSQELKRNITGRKEKVAPISKSDNKALTKEDMILLLSDMNLATKKDIEDLNKRLLKLEISKS